MDIDGAAAAFVVVVVVIVVSVSVINVVTANAGIVYGVICCHGSVSWYNYYYAT